MSANEPTYNAEFLGKLWDVTPRYVRQLAKEGVIPKSARGKYPLLSATTAYVKHLRDRNQQGYTSNDDFNKEKHLKLAAERKLAEMEVDEKEGKIIAVELVAKEWESEAARIRAKLLAMPNKMAPRMRGISSLPEIRALIKEEVYEVLRELSAEDDEPATRKKRRGK